MTYIYIAAILLQIGVIIFFVRRGRQQARAILNKEEPPAGDSYDGLRAMALGITPHQLKIAIPSSQTLVYGVVMDWNTGDMTVTLSAYLTGAANLYFSTGSGVNGGGKNPNVGEAAVRLVTAAQDYLDRAVATSGTADLPAPGCVRFYLLTNKNTFAAQELVKYFDDQSSAWLPLFATANEVVKEMQSS